jgi:hypothetical protein
MDAIVPGHRTRHAGRVIYAWVVGRGRERRHGHGHRRGRRRHAGLREASGIGLTRRTRAERAVIAGHGGRGMRRGGRVWLTATVERVVKNCLTAERGAGGREAEPEAVPQDNVSTLSSVHLHNALEAHNLVQVEGTGFRSNTHGIGRAKSGQG